MGAKSVFQSKTVWVNLIALIASVATAMGFDVGPDVQGELVGGIMAAANLGLRFVTKAPVEFK